MRDAEGISQRGGAMTVFGEFLQDIHQTYFQRKFTKRVMEGIMGRLGDGSGASDGDIDLLVKVLYLHIEDFDPSYLRKVAEILDRRSGALRARLVEIIAHAELKEVEDLVYRWKDSDAANEAYLKAVVDYEERKARNLRIPLSKGLLLLEVRFNVAPRSKKDIEYVVRQVLSRYPGTNDEREFVRWLRDNWADLNPYPSLTNQRPRWIQSVEWPCDETGRPLTFVGQINLEKSKQLTEDTSYYMFTDTKTGGFTVVFQIF